MMRSGFIFMTFLLLLPFSGLCQTETDKFSADADDFISSSMAELDVIPGVSIAVVRNGKPIYLRGFGLADIEANLSATPETPFYIASSTKSFVALTALLLHNSGELDLDASITKYLPSDKFPANVNAEKVTVRNLLTHTLGFENRPIVFRTAYTGDHTPELLVDLLSESTLNTEAPFGTFSYTNLGYNLLGMILEEQTGKSWQELVREQVLEPLGMTRTTPYASQPEKQGWPEAKPYFAFGESGVERITLMKKDNTMHAAGGMLSTASDLSRWLIVNLQNGSIDGETVFPPNLIKATHRKQVNTDANFFMYHRTGYGLGWYLANYGEETLIHHFGSFAGWRAHVSFMPDHDLGVAVLVNESTLGSTYADVLATYVYDWWLAGPDAASKYEGFVQRLLQQKNQSQQQIEADLADRASRTFEFTAPLSVYAGEYSNRAAGTMHISVTNDIPEVRIGNLHAIATPFTQENTIRVELIPGQGEVIGFYVDDEGDVPFLQYNGMRFQKK